MEIITYNDVESKIIQIRNTSIIIDVDIAAMYQVETKEVNQAVSRNKEKFPNDYIFDLTQEEKNILISDYERFKSLKHSTTLPKAFSEKGLICLRLY